MPINRKTLYDTLGGLNTDLLIQDTQGEVSSMTGLTEDIDSNKKRINREALERALYLTPKTEYYPGYVSSAKQRILEDVGYHPQFGEDYNALLLHREQSGTGMFFNFLNQAIVGQVAGGTIEGIGYLLDLPQYANIVKGKEEEWTNWFSEVGKRLRTWTEDVSPIYVDPTKPAFDPGSWSWWMSHGPSVASTLSLMIPSGLTVRGLGALGKALNIGTKMGINAQWALTGVSQAVISRHMENLMEVGGDWEENIGIAKDELYKLYSEEIKKEIESLPLSMPFDPERKDNYTADNKSRDIEQIRKRWEDKIDIESRKHVSVVAATNYRKQWAMLVQDVPQYLLLNRFGLGAMSGKAGKKVVEEGAEVAKRMGSFDPFSLYGRKSVAILKDMVGEGGEEMYQFFVNEQSKLLLRRIGDPDIKSSLWDVVKENYDNGELWSSFVFGALGAGVMQVGFAGLNAKIVRNATKQRLENIDQFGTMYTHSYNVLTEAIESGDPVKQETALANFIGNLGISAVEHNNLHNAIEFIEKIKEANPEDLANFGVPQEAGNYLAENSEVADRIVNDLNKVADLYDRFTKEASKNKNVKPEHVQNFARNMAFNKYVLDTLNKELQSSQERLRDTETAIGDFENLSETGKEVKLLQYDLEATKNALKRHAKRDKEIQDKGNELEKLVSKEVVAKLKLQEEQLKNEINKLKKDQPKEDKEKDSKVVVDDRVVQNYIKESERLNHIKASINQTEFEMEEYRSGKGYIADAKEQADAAEDTQEDVMPEVGDEVEFIDDVELKTARIKEIKQGEPKEDGTNQLDTYLVEELGQDGKPTGKVTTLVLNDFQVVKKITDESVVEQVEEGLTSEEEETAGIRSSYARNESDASATHEPINNLSYTHRDPNDPNLIVIRNEEVNKLLSDPKTNMEGSKAYYTFNIKDKKVQEQIKLLKESKNLNKKQIGIITKLFNGEKLNSADIDILLKSDTGSDFSDFVDIVPISVTLVIGGKKYTKELYLHGSNWSGIKAPLNVKDSFAFKNQKKLQMRKIRYSILTAIFEGRDVYTEDLRVGRGAPRTLPKGKGVAAKDRKRNVTKVFKQKPNSMTLGISKSLLDKGQEEYESGTLYIGPGKRGPRAATGAAPGSVFLIITETINGEPYALKLNKSTLTEEHADIVYDAFIALAKSSVYWDRQHNIWRKHKRSEKAKKKGHIGEFSLKWSKEDNRVFNLSVGEVLDLLVVHGVNRTDPSDPRYKRVVLNDSHRKVLANKRLYLEEANSTTYLVYGSDIDGNPYRINVKSPQEIKTKKQHFINWAKKNKTYAAHIESRIINLGLNGDFLEGREFRIGSVKREAKDNYTSFLLKNELLTTDVEVGENGLAFYAPILDLNLTSGNGVTNLREGKLVKARPKVEPKKTEEVKEPREVPEEVLVVESKKDETVEDVLKDFDNKTKFFSRPANRGKVQPYEIQDLEKELAWVAKNVGVEDVRVIKKLAELVREGRDNFALYTHSAILLYEAAEVGTLYHEAFHRVSLGYLNEKERRILYRAARILYKMPENEFTDRQVEERLAEEFRDFVLTKEKVQKPNKIQKFFQDIVNFIKALFMPVRGLLGMNRLNHADVNRLFEDIYRGSFRFESIRKDNLNNLGALEYARMRSRPIFNNIPSNKQLKDIVKSLTSKLFELNEVNDLNKIGAIKYASLIEYIEKAIVRLDNIKNNENNPGVERQFAAKVSGVFNDVLGIKAEDGRYSNFPFFREMMEDYLRFLGIRSKFQNEDTGLLNDSKNEDTTVNRIDTDYDKAAYELSAKDNALTSIKFLISTLYDRDENGETIVDPYTNLSTFVDFNEVWHKLLFDLHSINKIEDIVDELKTKAVSQNYHIYSEIATILEKASPQTKAQFLTTFRKHKHDFITFVMTNRRDGSKSFKVQDSGFNELSRTSVLKWYSNLLTNQNAVETTDQGVKQISESYIKPINKKLKEVEEKFEDAVKSLKVTDELIEEALTEVRLALGQVEIDVEDNATLRNYIENYYKYDNVEDKVQSLISDVNDFISLSLIETKFIEKRLTLNLAETLARTHPEKASDTVIGAGGNRYYSYSQHNLITYISNKINKDLEFVREKLSRIYNKRSVILNSFVPTEENPSEALKNREEFGVVTFGALRETGNRGALSSRDYLNVTALEGYMIKNAAIMNGMLPLPVLADRKTFFFMKGVPVLKRTVAYSIEDGTVKFREEVLDIFYNYYLDELDRVNEAKKVRAEYKAATEEEKKTLRRKLIKNYHYTGNFNLDKGNAYHFIHFKGFPLTGSKEDIKTKIEQVLNDRLKDEIEYSVKINYVGKAAETGLLSAIGMSESIVENLAAEGMPANHAVLHALANSMINGQMGVIESEKIFFADPAFFAKNKKSEIDVYDDMYKRWFGPGSTGDKFDNKSAEGKVSYEVSIFNDQTFKSAVYDDLLKVHTKLYYDIAKEKPVNKGKSEEELIKMASILAKKRLSAYEDIDATDGAVLVSPDMYREMAERLGKWGKEEDEAFNLLQSGKELTAEELIKSLNIVFNPFKTVYIGHHKHDNLDLLIYDKMAMFTLFRDQVKGTHLEEVLDRMEGKGKYNGIKPISAFKFSSAVKVGEMEGSEMFKDPETRDELNDLTEIPTYEQLWDNLSYQQVTEMHETDKQGVGTQMFKIVTSNLDLTAPYGDYETGRDLLDAVIKSRNSISNLGLHKVKAILGYRDGKISDSNLVSLLYNDAKLAGKSNDFVQALDIDPDTGEMYLELDSFSDRKWIYSRLINLVSKNTVDFSLPGNQLVQMPDWGNHKRGFKAELGFTTFEDGQVKEMECRVSVRLFKKFIPNYENMSDKQRKDFIKNNVLDILGYRIPTQGLNSIVKMKVVELLGENVGDLIQIPLEFVALTGSDFDIDKIFVSTFNYSYDKKRNKLNKIKFSDDSSITAVRKRYIEKVVELYHMYKLDPNVFDIELYKSISNLRKDIDYTRGVYPEDVDRVRNLQDEIKRLTEKVESTSGKESKLWYKSLLEVQQELSNFLDSIGVEERSIDFAEIDTSFKEELFKLVRPTFERLEILPSMEEFAKLPIEEQNTRKSLENRILDAFFTVLSDEKSLLSATTPLGYLTKNLKGLSEEFDGLRGNEYSKEMEALETSTPSFQAQQKTVFTNSKEGIGPNALSNSHHSLAQQVGLKMRTKLNFGFNKKGILDLSRIEGQDGVKISDWLSALIDAHVDAIKDPYIIKLNVNDVTYSVINLMIRAGVGVDTFYFVAQDSLKNYANEILLSGATNTEAFNRSWGILLDKYEEKGGNKEEVKAKGFLVPLRKLLDRGVLKSDIDQSSPKDKEYYRRQISILHFFHNRLSTEAQDLTSLVLLSRVDNKQFGRTPFEFLNFIMKIKQEEEKGKWINLDKLLNSEGKYIEGGSMLPTLLKNSVFFVSGLLSSKSIYSTHGFTEVVYDILKASGKGIKASSYFINDVMEETISYLFGTFFFDKDIGMGLTFTKARELMSSPSKSIFKLLNDIKTGKHPYSEELKKNKFVKALIIDYSDETDVKSYLKMPFRSMSDKWETDDYIEDFAALASHKDESVRDLGNMLYVYSFLTSGFRNRFWSFSGYIPSSMQKELSIKDKEGKRKLISFNNYIKQLLFDLSDSSRFLAHVVDAKREIFRNNWSNSSYVPRYTDKVIEKEYSEGDNIFAIEVDFLPVSSSDGVFLGQNAQNDFVFKPYILIERSEDDMNLFEYFAWNNDTSKPIYRLVSKKGHVAKGLIVKEYGIKSEKSIIPTNNGITIEEFNEKGSKAEVIYPEANVHKYISALKADIDIIPLANQIVTRNPVEYEATLKDFASEMRSQDKAEKAETTLSAFGAKDSQVEISKENEIVEDESEDFEEGDLKEIEEIKTEEYEVVELSKIEETKKEEASKVDNVESLSTQSNPIKIFVDGSVKPGPSGLEYGYGAYSSYNGVVSELSGTNKDVDILLFGKFPELKDQKQLNPSLELLGLWQVLKSLESKSEHVIIHQDYEGTSSYNGLWQRAVNTEGKSVKPWKANKPHIQYLVNEIVKSIESIEGVGGSVKIKWVPNNHDGNYAAKAKKYPKVFTNEKGVVDETTIQIYGDLNNKSDILAKSTLKKLSGIFVTKPELKDALGTFNQEDLDKGKEIKDFCK